jgi:hypothetical protein
MKTKPSSSRIARQYVIALSRFPDAHHIEIPLVGQLACADTPQPNLQLA